MVAGGGRRRAFPFKRYFFDRGRVELCERKGGRQHRIDLFMRTKYHPPLDVDSVTQTTVSAVVGWGGGGRILTPTQEMEERERGGRERKTLANYSRTILNVVNQRVGDERRDLILHLGNYTNVFILYVIILVGGER